MKKKTIYYWSPYLTEIATSKAVINSAYSLRKYFKNYETHIIDSVGEFRNKIDEINKKNVSIMRLNKLNLIPILPKHGKFNSRISFLIIFLISFFPLKNLLKKNKPDFLVIHLITSLPLILFFLFNFETKCILRISGFPMLGPIRKLLWSILLKKVHLVTCPTIKTLNYMKKLKIIDQNKLKLLYDPAISVREIAKRKNEKIQKFENELVAVGRLTKQKNFEFLIRNFKKIIETNQNLKLSIFGDGEQKRFLENKVKELSLQTKVKLVSFKENIFPYIKSSECFLLSSLWEDPGFVILEAAVCRTFVISSNCNNGPSEIIGNNEAGLLYQLNNDDEFIKTFNEFKNMSKEEIQKKKINALKKTKLFTIFNHAKCFNEILLN